MPKGVYPHRKMTKAEKKYLSDFWIGKKKSESHRKNISKAKMGEKNPAYGVTPSEETLAKRSKSLKGIPRTQEWRRNLSKNVKRGEECRFWRGGVATQNNMVRHSLEYKFWRESVFSRDNYTCQDCDVRGGELNADHIKPFALYPKLRFELSNGRTLCVSCHKKTPTYLNNKISI